MLSPAAFRLIRALGLVLLVSSLTSDLFLPSHNPGIGVWQLVAALLSAVIVLLTFLKSRRFLTYTLPILTANTILLLLILDALSLIVVRRFAARGIQMDRIATLEIESEEEYYPMPPACFYPYVFIRLEPNYSTRGVTSDSLGFRNTPGTVADDDAICIQVYGGSTVLGWGLPDSCTLPAMLQEELRRVSIRPVNVYNRGIATRNSTQSLIEFLLAIQIGDIPEAAVFYEGYNDGATAWLEADAGSQLGRRRVVALLCLQPEEGRESPGMLEGLALLKVTRYLTAGTAAVPTLLQEVIPIGRSMDPDELASQTMSKFTANCRLIRTVAGAFDIPVVIAWQPSLAPETKVLDPRETHYLAEMDRDLVEFQRILWDSARAYSNTDLYDWLGDVNSGVIPPVYTDYCHMNSFGTGLVAAGLSPLIMSLRIEAPDDSEVPHDD